VRSLALVINQADGQQWRMAMNTPPVLPVGTPEAFHNKQIRALAPDPATGKPNPQTLAAFFDAHPESAAFRAWQASYRPSDSWANTQYHSINAFVLVGADGQRQPVRWAMVPEQAFAPLGEGPHAADALSREFTQCLRAGPVRWTVRLQLAGPGDPTDNAAPACLESRRQIDAGRVELSGAEPQQGGACSGLNSDPLVLPRGIEASADPIQSNPIQPCTHAARPMPKACADAPAKPCWETRHELALSAVRAAAALGAGRAAAVDGLPRRGDGRPLAALGQHGSATAQSVASAGAEPGAAAAAESAALPRAGAAR
jgi:catalase